MRSRVTTKRGDEGETTALSGESLPKTHPIIECTGTLDELRAQIAVARLWLLREGPPGHEESADTLLWVVHVLFLAGAMCSDPLRKHPGYRNRDVQETDLAKLEAEQDRLEKAMAMPHAFIATATTMASGQLDLACTVARRFERDLARLMEATPDFDAGVLPAFFNRMSDYLFVLARAMEGGNHQTVDYELLLRW
ncbi:MAG: ATP:cob(I)alamin adenosyltransferase [bacterium]|nr:ATP:cob(I)alamin adenosyltransferase [bacterium]